MKNKVEDGIPFTLHVADVEKSSDLKAWLQFTNVAGTNGIVPVIDRAQGNFESQFYRAVSP